jgi:hypothetical protein
MNVSRHAFVSLTAVALVLALGFAAPAAFAQSGGGQMEKVLFDNTNKAIVQNGPSAATIFRVEGAQVITYIMTYHYNNYGALPGSILLINGDGTIYGPWQASGKTGQAGVANAVWEAYPEVEVKAGTYMIIDSDFRTWSTNTGSGNRGHAIVKGRPAGFYAPAPTPLPPSVSTAPGSDGGESADLAGEWELVGNGAAGPMTISLQSGALFSGSLYSEKLVDGRVSGSTITFTRSWGSSSLRQDFTGTLAVDSSGRMTMSGTFTQNGAGSYLWSAVKKR